MTYIFLSISSVRDFLLRSSYSSFMSRTEIVYFILCYLWLARVKYQALSGLNGNVDHLVIALSGR